MRRWRSLRAFTQLGGSYGKEDDRPRSSLFSSAPVSAEKGSRPKPRSNAGCRLSTGTSSCSKSSAATIPARAVRTASSRTAACSPASFDGSDRHYFFPRVACKAPGIPLRPDHARTSLGRRFIRWHVHGCTLVRTSYGQHHRRVRRGSIGYGISVTTIPVVPSVNVARQATCPLPLKARVAPGLPLTSERNEKDNTRLVPMR
jgi:hypothetical protein